MKINVLTVDQFYEGEQSVIVKSYDDEHYGEESLYITKKVFEGDEFFAEAKRLTSENQELADALVGKWIKYRAHEAIAKYIPKARCDESSQLIAMYFAGTMHIILNAESYTEQIIQLGDGCDTHLVCGLCEYIIRSYYPTLGKRTKKYQGLLRYIISSCYDGARLHYDAGITLECRRPVKKIS